MDPLSIISGILAIGAFTTASLKIILRIRGASDEVQALINEISDLSAILNDVEHTLRNHKHLSAKSTGVASLTAVLTRGNTTVNHLHSFVHRVLMKEESLLGNARLSRIAWLKEKPQVAKYQRQLSAIRTELSHALSIANLSSGARIELSVANVIALTDQSKTLLQSQAEETRELRKEIGELRQLVGSGPQDTKCSVTSPSFPQPNVLPLYSSDVEKHPGVVLEGRRGLEVQLVWRPHWACDASCHCICHEPSHGRSPRQLDRLLGILFWGYAGLPVLRKSCDVRDCRKQRGLKFGMSYYFPAWFVEKKFELVVRSMPLGTPQVCIKMANIVSNGALLFKYAHTGDIPGIQSLFSQGLGAPSDAGHLDGCTVLHFAVERGNIKMINFLLKANADPYALNTHLESPASYAWDIILGNSMDRETTDFLRAAFSDRDLLEEQNFNSIHEVVLGLNGRKLIDSINERPRLVDSPDGRGNTPLIWAAIRGDTQALRELLEYGASTEYRNDNGWNALYAAVNHSRLDCAALLLKSGYNDYKDGYGMTALHRACQQPDPVFVRLLLQHEINVDEQDVFQRCPLALAAWRNNALGVSYLLKRGANKEIRDIFGATPLLRAVQYAAADAAGVLLEGGCDVLAVDFESQTILHRTALSRDIPTMNMLVGKAHFLCDVDINAEDKSGKTARDRLDTVEPSAELLKAFTAMITAISAAKKIAQVQVDSSKDVNSQDVFEDAKEYPSDGSPALSCSDTDQTDDEKSSSTLRRTRTKLLLKPIRAVRTTWSSKYKNTFRSFERASDSAASSTTRLISV